MSKIRWRDIVTEVAADWIARFVYFAGTATACAVLLPYSAGSFDLWSQVEFWVFACFLGILVAFAGPGLYRRNRQRGLGKLDEIRARSRVGAEQETPAAVAANDSRRNGNEHV